MRINIKYLSFLTMLFSTLFLMGASLGQVMERYDEPIVAAFPIISGLVRTGIVVCGLLVVAYFLSQIACMVFWGNGFSAMRAEERTKDGWPNNGYSRTDKVMLVAMLLAVILGIALLFGGFALQLWAACVFGGYAFAALLMKAS